MGIAEIKRNNIGDQVYHQLKKHIVNGEWQPGEKLPSENQLINMLAVSRGTVRQAIQRLAGEGLIVTRHGEGSFVQGKSLDQYFQTVPNPLILSDADVEKTFEFRTMFESGVAEMAAQKATPEQITQLEDNYQRMITETESIQRYVNTDMEFHMLIGECTQNTLVMQIFNSYEELLLPSILSMTGAIGSGNGVKYHKLLLEAIRDHDGERARILMHEHLVNNVERYKQSKSLENNL